MEKCTYCIQRITTARTEASKEGRRVRDGDILTACQAACPTQAIIFGDINDTGSVVRQVKEQPLNYDLLGELGTQPRTTYLAAVRNPNPDLED
jgi:molybdopterin-containing oxidoreductase family iron-sulfur binding subunit